MECADSAGALLCGILYGARAFANNLARRELQNHKHDHNAERNHAVAIAFIVVVVVGARTWLI